MPSSSYIIPGAPITSTNSKQLLKFGDRVKLVPSKQARAYQEAALWHLKGQRRGAPTVDEPCEVRLDVYRERNAGDVDNYPKAIFDALQAAGIIKNDNLIKRMDVRILKDKERPRVEILIAWPYN